VGVSQKIDFAADATSRRASAVTSLGEAGPDGSSKAAPSCWLSSLSLDNFRNYKSAKLVLDQQPVVLFGHNGAGKTNMLEAVSLLAPGRGMRRAKSEHLPMAGTNMANWAVAAELETSEARIRIGSGVPVDSDTGRRIMRCNGETVSQAEIGGHFSVSWLTPQMDGIFVDTPGARRRFLDRLVIAFDPAHIGRINRYDKILRERSLLLSEGRGDETWFVALEAGLAETAVAITAARQALIKDLNTEAHDGWFGFPGIRLELVGDVETWLAEMPALAVEDRLIKEAAAQRGAGESRLAGPHASDLGAFDTVLDKPAVLASTGQQKALLIAVVLAHARLQHRRLGQPPLMLLDDVAAHLDDDRRLSLFEALAVLGGQTWFTGTSDKQFKGLGNGAKFIRIFGGDAPDKTPQFEVI